MSIESLRARLRSGEPIVVPGVHDALAAKLAARAGFSAVFVSGFGLSASLLGEPDFGFIGMPEVLDAADRIARAVHVPVIVDIDTGYGNAFHVEKVVTGLIARGAKGCFLEDQEWPKRCGHMERKRVVDVEQYLPKLRAALAARGDADFLVAARTDARAVLGLDEAIRRGRLYAEAGADAVFVEAPQSVEEMRRIRAAIPSEVVLIANMVESGKTPLRSARELAADGFAFVLYPVSGLLAAARAMEDVFAVLARDGSTLAATDRMLAFHEINAVTGLPERYAQEKAWLT
jgi:2-methylisocitrate lyase-like PEP mutase family enzyme